MNGPRRWLPWLLASVLFVGHFVLHVGFGLGRVAPDLLTVALLLVARELGLASAAAVGLFLGLLEDALSVLVFGASTIAMTVVGALGAWTREYFVGDSRLFVVSYLFVGKWMRDLIHWIAVGEGLRPPFVDHVLVQGALGSAYAAAVGLVLVGVLGMGREP